VQTIREAVKRRVRRLALLAVAGWLVIPASVLVASWTASGSGRGELPPWAFLGIVAFAAAILGLNFGVRCLKCRTRFGQLALEIAFHWGRRARVNFCPFCGTGLDEPLP